MFRDNSVVYRFFGPWGVQVDVGQSIMFLALVLIGFSVQSPTALLWSVAYFCMIVLSIYLHELGHAWGCLVQGIPVRRIMIYGGGGFCEHARAATPKQSELIVIMGPLVNLGLWAISDILLYSLDNTVFLSANPSGVWNYIYAGLSTFGRMNLFLCVLNMIPVFPLDGGRLFQLLLLRFLGRPLAARISGGVGLIFSLLWIPAMIYGYFLFGWMLLFLPSIPYHWQMLKGGILP